MQERVWGQVETEGGWAWREDGANNQLSCDAGKRKQDFFVYLTRVGRGCDRPIEMNVFVMR